MVSHKKRSSRKKMNKTSNPTFDNLSSGVNDTEEDLDNAVSNFDGDPDEDSDSDLEQDIDTRNQKKNGADASDDEGSVENEGDKHKESLQKLRQTDPEFYKFLQSNDKKLLQFNVSDNESEAEDEDEDTDNVHKPDCDLEVGSDESDCEAEGIAKAVGTGNVITLKMVKVWQEQLQTDNTVATIRNVTRAFHAALYRVTGDEADKPSQYKVDGSSVFNAVVQLCVLELQPAIKRFLKIKSASNKIQPNKCKRWKKLRSVLKLYLVDLLKLLSGVSSCHIVAVLLKHLHQLAAFVACFSIVTKNCLKKLMQLWGSGEETVRVIAFLCILRLTTRQQQQLLPTVLKMMYITYVNNCKFVSPNTLPGINFMRRSLTEIYALDQSVSYQHVFLYIRQLAIHLRNAVTLHKKEHMQAVYNWQFIHSLHLWTELLSVTNHKPQLQPLIHPLVQVIIGTVKLIPTSQYYPLRFHCLRMLTHLARNTETYIPVLPFILEVLNTFDFNKKHKKVSMKPLDIMCVLRLSKAQQQENGFKDAILEEVYKQLLDYLAGEAHSISFPDAMVPTLIQLRKFLKTCKIAKYCKKLRQVLDKIEENSRFVENERRKISVSLNDHKAISAWETNVKLKGTPLITFYESWNKLHTHQMFKKATDNEKLGDFHIPTLKKFQKRRMESEEEVKLFPSDDESDNNMSFGKEEPKKKRQRKQRKESKITHAVEEMEPEKEDEEADIVEDFRLSDLE